MNQNVIKQAKDPTFTGKTSLSECYQAGQPADSDHITSPMKVQHFLLHSQNLSAASTERQVP